MDSLVGEDISPIICDFGWGDSTAIVVDIKLVFFHYYLHKIYLKGAAMNSLFSAIFLGDI